MQTCANLTPGNGFDAAGAVVFHSPADLRGPCLLHAYVRLLNAFEKPARELRAIFGGKLRCLLIQLFNDPAHARSLYDGREGTTAAAARPPHNSFSSVIGTSRILFPVAW